MFGIRIGQGALNECAAWLLDSSERSRGFSRVPPTAQASPSTLALALER